MPVLNIDGDTCGPVEPLAAHTLDQFGELSFRLLALVCFLCLVVDPHDLFNLAKPGNHFINYFWPRAIFLSQSAISRLLSDSPSNASPDFSVPGRNPNLAAGSMSAERASLFRTRYVPPGIRVLDLEYVTRVE